MNYPDLHIAYEAGAKIEQTMLMIALITAACLVWLWLARFEFPRYLPATRLALVALFFVSLAVFVLMR